MEALTKILIG